MLFFDNNLSLFLNTSPLIQLPHHPHYTMWVRPRQNRGIANPWKGTVWMEVLGKGKDPPEPTKKRKIHGFPLRLVHFSGRELACAASCPLLLFKIQDLPEDDIVTRILDIARLYPARTANRKNIIEAGLSQGFFMSIKQARLLVPKALDQTGTLASLVKGACVDVSFGALRDYVQLFGITSCKARTWLELLRDDPALFAMTHPNGMPIPSFYAIQELHDCSHLLRKRMRWGHTAIALPTVCLQYEGSKCDDLIVFRKDDACCITLLDFVDATVELATLLAKRINDLSLTIHPRGVKKYVQNEFNALACHRTWRGDDVLVVCCLPNEDTVSTFLKCVVLHNSMLPDTWLAPKGASTRVVIVCDAHTMTELELLRLLRWCDSNEVGRVRLYGRTDGTPPCERGAGCPFYDIGFVLAGGSWVSQREAETPLVKGELMDLPDSNWAIIVTSSKERQKAEELVKEKFGNSVLVSKHVFIGDQLPRLGLWTRLFLFGEVPLYLRHLAEEMIHKDGKVMLLPGKGSTFHPRRDTLLSQILRKFM